MRGGCGHMCMWEGAWVFTRRDEARKMRHIDMQIGANAVGDLTHALEVNLPWDSRPARHNELGFMLGGQFLNLFVVQQVVLIAHAILHRIEPFARLVWRGSVGQMPARVQGHTKDRSAGLQQRLKHTLVGLAAGIWLNIGKFASKQLACPFDRHGLGNIHIFTAAVVAPPNIAFGVFVGHDRALCLHHGLGDNVFRCDQFNLIALACQLFINGLSQGWVGVGEICIEELGEAGCHDFAPWAVWVLLRVSYRKCQRFLPRPFDLIPVILAMACVFSLPQHRVRKRSFRNAQDTEQTHRLFGQYRRFGAICKEYICAQFWRLRPERGRGDRGARWRWVYAANFACDSTFERTCLRDESRHCWVFDE